uniref:Uncharacterized protein n=1 Tax=Strigamia maritima TaxID=126957 RepID=T1IN57_STRMM
MGHWSTPTTFLYFIWDFIYVWLIGTFDLLRQLVVRHRKPTVKRDGNVAIVTGGSRGIGLEIVKQLLECGYHTIIAASSPHNQNIEKIKEDFPNGNVEYFQIDMCCTKSIRSFADNFLKRNLPLNVLINNAGIMFGPYKLNENGIESQLNTNYLGHFLLAYLLLPVLTESGTEKLRSRVVNVTSCVHYAGRVKIDDLNSREYYSAHGSYAQSKLAQVMHAITLQELLDQKGAFVCVNSVHPGIIHTNLYQHTIFDKLFFKTAEQGADGVVHVALSNEIEGIGGKYFDNCIIKRANKLANVPAMQLKLWQKTCEILEIKDFDLHI